MAHIEKRGAGKYRARYRDPDGRERSRTFPRKVDAERFLTSMESSKMRGEWIAPALGRIMLAKWADRWFATTAALKPKTRLGYESLLRNQILPTFGAMPLSQIRPVEVHEWLVTLSDSGLSASRVRQAYNVLAQMLAAAVESGYLSRTPCVGVKLPRLPRTEMLFLDAQQVEALAVAVPADYVTLIFMLAYGGLRWGEVAALRRRRCDFLRSRLEVVESLAEVNGQLIFGPTKTYQHRTVVMPTFLRDLLAQHLDQHVPIEADALVFATATGRPLRNGNFRRSIWQPAIAAAGLPERLRLHDLRHTCASLLIAQGANVKAIQTQLGHSSAQVTLDRYGHLMPDEMDRVAVGLDATRATAIANLPRPIRGLAPDGTITRGHVSAG